MGKQLIFCVETNSKAKTDWIYIQELIKAYFKIDNDIKLTPVFMGSKQKYNSNKVKKEISDNIKMYSGESEVILCIDTDQLNQNPTQVKEFENIKNYAKDKDYHFVWFNSDIESVFLGRTVTNERKVIEAGNFQRNNGISKVDLNLLKKTTENGKGSNIMNVLSKLLDNLDLDNKTNAK